MLRVIPGVFLFVTLIGWNSIGFGQSLEDQHHELVQRCVQKLVALQHDDGAWPYEGVYRVRREIPVGYRIGGTAIVCQALLHHAGEQQEVKAAIQRGVDLILQELEDPLMASSVEDSYDVRVWGHIYALTLFCDLKLSNHMNDSADKYVPWIEKLVTILGEEEIRGGGWNYANQRRHAPFVTAPAAQALLRAREAGAEVPDELFARTASALKASRNENGAYQYSGSVRRGRTEPLPGSIARSAVCEATLIMLGQGDQERLKLVIDGFHEHWDELEKRRKKTGTHEPPYGVAPYYFYYGHRYLGQAIALLPVDQQQDEYARFNEVLLKTKDDDDTWNDRVFDQSKAFGTAMSILGLSPESVPLPRFLDSKE